MPERKLNDFVFASDLFKKIKVAEDIISEDAKGDQIEQIAEWLLFVVEV